jgi:hypothetical protein
MSSDLPYNRSIRTRQSLAKDNHKEHVSPLTELRVVTLDCFRTSHHQVHHFSTMEPESTNP